MGVTINYRPGVAGGLSAVGESAQPTPYVGPDGRLTYLSYDAQRWIESRLGSGSPGAPYTASLNDYASTYGQAPAATYQPRLDTGPYPGDIRDPGSQSSYEQMLADRQAAYQAQGVSYLGETTGGILSGEPPSISDPNYSGIAAALGSDFLGLSDIARQQAEAARQEAAGAYGGAISQVNQQIAEAQERRDRDTGIVQGLIDGAAEIYAGVMARAEQAGAAAAAAIEANTAEGEKALAREHRGAEGKVRAIMDLVGSGGNEAVFMELTEGLDEAMGFIAQGFALTAEGQAALVDQAQNMAVTAARATEATMQSEHGRTLDELVTRFNGILEGLFSRRASLYAARARAIEAADAALFQSLGANFPQSPEDYAAALQGKYIEESGLPRSQQVLAFELIQDMNANGFTSIQDYVTAYSDGDEQTALVLYDQMEPYADVVRDGLGTYAWGQDHYMEIVEGIPTNRVDQGLQLGWQNSQAYGSHAQGNALINDPDINAALYGLPAGQSTTDLVFGIPGLRGG